MLGNVISEMGARETSLCPSASEEEDGEQKKHPPVLQRARVGNYGTLICGRAGEASHTRRAKSTCGCGLVTYFWSG
jgi:hypothetical protein